jgi:hypothetical protein
MPRAREPCPPFVDHPTYKPATSAFKDERTLLWHLFAAKYIYQYGRVGGYVSGTSGFFFRNFVRRRAAFPPSFYQFPRG